MTLLKEKNIDLPYSQVASGEVKLALEKIQQLDFPTRKTEDWRYAKLGKIINKQLGVAVESPLNIEGFVIPGLDVYQMVFVNGTWNQELSILPSNDGVRCGELTKLPEDLKSKYYNQLIKDNQEIFSAINTAYVQEGCFVEIGKNVKLDKPLYILNVFQGTQVMTNSRTLVMGQTGSEAQIIQGYFATEAKEHFNNALSEVYVAANAKISIHKIQALGEENRQVATEEVYQEKDATFKINTFQINGEFLRNGLNIKVDGENCYTEMNGFFQGNGNAYFDNHTRVDHLKSHCTSSELYKGILKGNSTGVFNGKVIVHQDAQVIEAFQQNNNVILSDSAVMNTKPELEIYADDVKCSHGTTTGQFDEEALFYLQARGVSKDAAKELLIGAFAQEVFEKVEEEAVVKFVQSLMK